MIIKRHRWCGNNRRCDVTRISLCVWYRWRHDTSVSLMPFLY